ncbi:MULTISPECIES: DUF1801 domain-containing protein [Roseivirga]|uniref:YdhG-like domain-containing protein n=1 Tax=Roseivirga thermotolerans TaxID=1758176 RepID=A0ABQ3I8C9_9BACT|nr:MULTISPECIES: DUF1801 domain-containing protein [Roseivirga]GHE63847.1 hypothetical protein GCM10011340_19110 [Roseivirga thermotolerans]|tara:strand:+ start:15802 stop:16221 length:420 start_codon:yes stop_codon:yes gene_type:complete
MIIVTDPRVLNVFSAYPDEVRLRMSNLRSLLIEAATEIEGLSQLEETLKWGEPSYLTAKGSTVRMDWKPKAADKVAVYFKCTSRLVPTFRTLYDQALQFEGNRSIVLPLTGPFPYKALKHCIQMALNYHKIKHLPLLGN